MSRYEEQLARQIEVNGLPAPERQYAFASPLRQYRVDFAWPERALVVETDGGAFVGRGGFGAVVSRTIPAGYHQTVEDYRKRNLLNLLGWRVLAYQPEQIARGEAIAEIRLALEAPPLPGTSPTFSVSASHPWMDALGAHVAGLAQVDRARRRVREAKTKQRRWLRGERR